MFNDMSLVEILKLFAPLIVIQFILIIIGIRSLIKDEVKFMPKWAWAIIIILINLFGPIIYLFIGRKRD